MIFQLSETLRLFVIFVPQIFLVVVFSFLIFKILKRNTNRNSLTLCGFYITVSISLALNGIVVLIAFFFPGEYIGILYLFLTYLTIFSFVFIVVFILGLLNLQFTINKALILILIYGVVWLILLLYPGGITYSENWSPIYSFTLYIAANILFTITFTIPVIFYSLRLRRLFKDSNLKKKLSLFLSGNMLLNIIIYGALLYNTWQDPTFRTVWSFSTFVLLISSGLLIYYGIGRDL